MATRIIKIRYRVLKLSILLNYIIIANCQTQRKNVGSRFLWAGILYSYLNSFNMQKSLYYFFLLIISVLFSQCIKDTEISFETNTTFAFAPADPITVDCNVDLPDPCSTNLDGGKIRIRNFTRYDMCNVVFEFVQRNHNYGKVRAGETTCSGEFESIRPEFSKISFETTLGAYEIQYNPIDPNGTIYMGNYELIFNLSETKNNSHETEFHFTYYRENETEYFSTTPAAECDDSDRTECNTDPDKVNIRVVNLSSFDFCDIQYQNYVAEKADFGNLVSGDTSCYIPFFKANEHDHKIGFFIGEFHHEIDNIFGNTSDSVEPGFYTLYLSMRRLTGGGIHYRLIRD